MLFNSYVFLFAFLPVALIGYHALSRGFGPKAAKLWLIGASLVYYGWWSPPNVLLILLSMAWNFGIGRLMGRTDGGRIKMLLVLGIGVDLLLLGYFKYANFFIANAGQLFGADWSFPKVLLPLGISFFTFQQITYLVDASRGIGREYDPADYILFVSFFPHSIAGPIVHHQEMMPQFARPSTYRFNWDNLAVGLALFAGGLSKKLMIADALSVHVARVFGAASGSALGASDAWAGALSYTFQIYFDFSAYSDMALGLARMFGITLPLNFNSPYKAVNCVEFWRRWHMTLSRCLRDYLYIPLGGNRRGKPRQYLNLLLTMLIGGLWHGAGWTFIAWGGYHGACLCANHFWAEAWERHFPKPLLPAAASLWTGRVLTFLAVVIGWVLFRASSLHAAGNVLAAMFYCGSAPLAGAPQLVKGKTWFWLVGLTAFVWTAPNLAEMFHEFKPALNPFQGSLSGGPAWLKWKPTVAWACVAAACLVAAVLCLSSSSEFLYYNF